MSHPNRSGRGASRNPTPEEIREFRTAHNLSATEFGRLVHSTQRRAQQWAAGDHRMHPGLWELAQIKVAQMTADDIEEMLNELGRGMRDLAASGPNTEDYVRCVLALGDLQRAVEALNKEQPE